MPRAIAIATGLPYRQVYEELHRRAKAIAVTTRPGTKRHAVLNATTTPRDGVRRSAYQPYLESLGWEWVRTTQTRLRATDLPHGRLIVAVPRHLAAVVDGLVHDTFDPTGARVFGYFRPRQTSP